MHLYLSEAFFYREAKCSAPRPLPSGAMGSPLSLSPIPEVKSSFHPVVHQVAGWPD